MAPPSRRSLVAALATILATSLSLATAAAPPAAAGLPTPPPPTSADRPGAPLGALTVKPGTYPTARTVAAQDVLAGVTIRTRTGGWRTQPPPAWPPSSPPKTT